ncbi:MAG: hypothetical protein Q9187_004880 [Circinaria calcarea]
MPRASAKNESSSATPLPSLKKSTSGSQSGQNQKSILGFFQKKAVGSSQEKPNSTPKFNGSVVPSNATEKKTLVQRVPKAATQSLTPLPSSDALDGMLEDEDDEVVTSNDKPKMNGLPSPITPAAVASTGNPTSVGNGLVFSSPSRKAKKVVNYVESGDEEDEDEEAFMPTRTSSKAKGRQLKRRRTKEASEEEDIFQDNENHMEDPDEGG